ncbi:hypothetical protein MMC24_007313 [Lignoscripta atroalba]|nr:hypothetical protein [Lignoscripta atroalba]
MATSAVAQQQRNGVAGIDQELLEYEKIIKLRDEIFAGTHPRLKAPPHARSNVHSRPVEVSPKPGPRVPNGYATVPRPSTDGVSLGANHAQRSTSHISSLQKTSNARHTLTSGAVSSGLDPIFLTKSEDLVRAEMRLERQRIERSLEEQVHQRRIASRQRVPDQEAVPDFDVTEVLAQAQELVKPITLAENIGANGIASSSDSFDENTFYSSQINESTTEEADEYSKWRPHKPCKYFFTGTCKKGDACTFSHDPAFKQKLQRGISLTLDADSFDMEEPTSARGPRRHPPSRDDQHTEVGMQQQPPNSLSAKQPDAQQSGSDYIERDLRFAQEESAYSPPAALEPSFDRRGGRPEQPDVQESLNYRGRDPISLMERTEPESILRRETHLSPSSRDIRIVRNHITSPFAPQPARVSPLAVARVPKLSQVQRIDHEGHTPKKARAQTRSVQQSPNGPIRPINLRKRRRDPEPGESTRNVAVRRRMDSPEPYIKEEPLSPPPFTEGSSRRQLHRGQVGRPPLLVETASPYRTERVVHQHRNYDYPQRVETSDVRDPSTPVVRREISRAGRHYEVQEEPEMRRIVSARQPHRVRSPVFNPVTLSAPHLQPTRAASQSYPLQHNPDRPQQFRVPVQPQSASYVRHDRSLSPLPRRVQYSPIGQEVQSMAPPPRRIVVDQYGNKYYEAPLAPERRASVAPGPRAHNEFVAPHEQVVPHRASVHPQNLETFDDRGYLPGIMSPGPTSPRYVEYYPAVEVDDVANRERIYEPAEEAYVSRQHTRRLIEYPEGRQPGHYEEVLRPRDGIARMHSIRPVDSQYESPRDRVMRVQSVRPEQERIVSLGGRREVVRPVIRQVSVRADDGYARPTSYVASERPRYQYLPEAHVARYVDDDLEDDMVLEAPRNADRRPLQRL